MLDEVVSWIDNNGLKMNVKETQLMFLGRKGRKAKLEHASIVHRVVSLALNLVSSSSESQWTKT